MSDTPYVMNRREMVSVINDAESSLNNNINYQLCQVKVCAYFTVFCSIWQCIQSSVIISFSSVYQNYSVLYCVLKLCTVISTLS